MGSIRERAGAVVDHHYDTSNPDKPLWLMFPAGAVAVVALGWTVWICYQAWFAARPAPAASAILPFTLILYFAGVFGFSYGYELYDTGRAVRLTAKLGLIGLAAVLIIVALAFVLGAIGKGRKFSPRPKGDEIEKALTGVGRIVANTTFHRRVDVSGYLPPEANVCSYCARPLPPAGSPTSAALVDPDAYCPRCGQAFEPAGERARQKPVSS